MKRSKRTKVITLLSVITTLSLVGCTNTIDSNIGSINDENQVDDSIVTENSSTESENDPIDGPPAGAYMRL